ncbi:hypothetical protein CAPTEDRAFT_175223 [Capitella teleta]|uniref:Nucleoside diphosphate-linked moiety X motif 6 n=1 Tax=Capitella teleta TaxID=283909 RepID=R7UEB0_CAPTE|nr:hypothetical protein CAPTEDRAFT_175223 [Capitella teleta]|eukprot:ELU04314.1 hypothetical protein CAPTEDRAFT_175223 [Capitella teleta]
MKRQLHILSPVQLLNNSALFKGHRVKLTVNNVCLTSSNPPILEGECDKYQGMHIDLADGVHEDFSVEKFDLILGDSLCRWKKEGFASVWIRFTLQQGALISVAANHGFVYHHAENKHAVMCQWLDMDSPSRLPQFATHQVGVAGCVVDHESKSVLVIRDKHKRYSLWKFPGGLAELGEDLNQTAVREIYEETGVKSEFHGILAFRQQHDQPSAYGRSDLYFVCYMTPLTFDLKPCLREIEACMWMDLEELESHPQTSAITRRIVKLVKKGLGEGFNDVTFVGQEFQSIYKDLKYVMYHRGIVDDGPLPYVHSILEARRKKTTG